MVDRKIIITYATPKVCKQKEKHICELIQQELPIELRSLAHIQDIFPKLSDPAYHTDYILFDVDDVEEIDHVEIFDLVRTLSTIINCTVCRQKASARPLKRTTKIIALISEHTPVKLYKQLLSMTEIDNFSLKVGEKVNYEMIKEIVGNYISDHAERPHKIIVDMMKPKKAEKKKITGTINLTARQQQIFDIITTRGASNKHIAKMLDISESTVKLHMGAILKKYNLKNRTQLAVFCKK